MSDRSPLPKRFAVTLAATALVGCGGGGGGRPPASTTPSPTPTGTQAAQTSTSSATLSVLSYPIGLTVTLANGKVHVSGATPFLFAPPAVSSATTITYTPTNGHAPFAFVTDQNGGEHRTVVFNQDADTSGRLGTIVAAAAIGRRAVAMANTFATTDDGPRFPPSAMHGRPATSASRIIVRYRAASLHAQGGRRAETLERGIGLVESREIGFEHDGIVTHVVTIAPGDTMSAAIARLRAQPEVLTAEPERLYYLESTSPVTPNDTHFNPYQSWNLFRVEALDAWGYTRGSPSVPIAIIDTGADFTHPELAGKITYAERVRNGVVTVGDVAAQDTGGHGTNVAGIASANTNNSLGFAAMGYDTPLQIYNVFGDGTAATKYETSANSGDIAQAIYDAVTHRARVINMSLGTCQGAGPDSGEADAVAYAIAQNVVVVAAAGNERAGSTDPTCADSGTVDLPAAFDGVVSVGATKLDDTVSPRDPVIARERVAGYSNAGPGLSLVAPGGDPTAADIAAGSTGIDYLHWIYGLYTATAADPKAQCRNKLECNAVFAGTSQATPLVSATAALMLAANPSLTVAEVKGILIASADDIGDPYEGNGRLNAYRALAAATGDPHPPALPSAKNFVAIAYAPNGTNQPAILDVTFQNGVPLASDGTFRIADLPDSVGSYKIGLWYDANGNGRVDAGDYFGSSPTCVASTPCAAAATINVAPVQSGFVLR